MLSASNFYALVLTALVLVGLAANVRSDPLRVFRSSSVALLVVLSWYLLEAVTGCERLIAIYGQDAYDQGVFAVALATVCFFAGYGLGGTRLFVRPYVDAMRVFESRELTFRITFVGSMVGLLATFYYVDFDPLGMLDGVIDMKARFTSVLTRGRYGGGKEAVYSLSMFNFAIVPLAFQIAISKDYPLWQRVYSGTVCVWSILRMANSGTRSFTLMLIIPLVIIIALRFGPRLRRIVLLSLAPAFVVGAFAWSTVVVSGRVEGTLDEEVLEDSVGEREVGFEMFRELLASVRETDEGRPFAYGYSYYYQIVNPVPRALWPGKPRSEIGLETARYRGKVYADGEPYLSISPGILGEMYLNFGWFGLVFVSALGGWLLRSWDYVFDELVESPLLFPFFVGAQAALFFLGRSFTAMILYWAFAAWLIAFAFSRTRLARRAREAAHQTEDEVYEEEQPAPLS